ncbi:MAG TPA: glycosyltransferase family 39 protein [Candidatus Binatia bacterium]|nr:glycosyltransferase family 39 protein [Candidatus Binatia bacterium]
MSYAARLPAGRDTRRSERAARLALVLALAAFFVQSARGIESESLTFDEPPAIGSAHLAFRRHDLRLVKERPPLLGLFITPALVLSGDPRLPPVGDPRDVVADGRFGDAFLHDAGNDPIRILRVCRYTVLVLSLGLGAAIWAWAVRLGGPGAGILAAVLFAFCPNLLAHSRIAANDMTCAIFVFVAVFALDAFRRRPTPARAALAGVGLGLALAAKLSAVLVLPLAALVLLDDLRRRGRDAALPAAIVAAAAVLTLGACMGGTFDYGTYLAAFGHVYRGTRPGYLFYLGGALSPRPWWYYHLYAAAIKTPLSLLALFGAGTLVLLRRARDRMAAVLVLGPILLFLVASCFDTANIGLRRILPIYPFVILAAAQSIERRAATLGIVVLCAWQAVAVLRIAPHHLSYFNELVGGPTGGILHLDDSNIDWGQDLPSLRRWLDAHPGLPVRLDYFGAARPGTYGIRLPAMDEDREICAPERAVYAVSAHLLVFFEKVARERGPACSWLHRHRPVDRAGYSIWVYDFR